MDESEHGESRIENRKSGDGLELKTWEDESATTSMLLINRLYLL